MHQPLNSPKTECAAFRRRSLKEFAGGDLVGLYNGTLIYESILDALMAPDIYREGVTVVTRGKFDASSIKLTKQVTLSDKTFHSVWLV